MTDRPIPEHVAGTHAIVWHLDRDPKLSQTARDVFRQAEAGAGRVYVSVISLVELVYLADRGRLDRSVVERVLALVDTPNGSYVPIDVGLDIVRALADVPRDAVPDMPDRIIVATASHLGLPLISRDERIRDAGVVPVVW